MNNFNFNTSKFFNRNSLIECQELSQTNKEIFQSWQVFKDQVRKTIKDAITRICVKYTNPNCYGKISPEILKNFWPENKLNPNSKDEDSLNESKIPNNSEEIKESNFVNQRVVNLLKYVDQRIKSADVQKVSSSPIKKTNRTKKNSDIQRARQISKASGYSAMMSRSQYEDNNPFLRVAKLDKKMGKNGAKRSSYFIHSNPRAEPLFNKECEQSLLYRQLIDEDKLQNQNIQDFFKINHQNLAQHLLLLFMAHVDDLLVIMGPLKSIEFILPIYFTILNVNSIYHCNFKNINLEKKPVRFALLINFSENFESKDVQAIQKDKKN
jgi:hypothetical protein